MNEIVCYQYADKRFTCDTGNRYFFMSPDDLWYAGEVGNHVCIIAAWKIKQPIDRPPRNSVGMPF